MVYNGEAAEEQGMTMQERVVYVCRRHAAGGAPRWTVAVVLAPASAATVLVLVAVVVALVAVLRAAVVAVCLSCWCCVSPSSHPELVAGRRQIRRTMR